MVFGWGKAAAPARVPTDEVQPLHFLDGVGITESLIMAWQLRFDDVIDAGKLHAALARLLEIGSWRRLGGRLRRRPDGKLELHIPQTFTVSRPAVRYTHDTFHIALAEHPLGSQFPHATPEHISLHPSPEAFRPFLAPAHNPAPGHLNDYLLTDTPVLGLHIVSFTDATLVSVTWPHTISDALGMLALAQNWTAVLNGREADVRPLLGATEDPLADVGVGELHPSEAAEPYAMRDKVLKGFGLVRFMVRFVWELFWQPTHEQRVICIPPRAMAALRTQGERDLLVGEGSADSKLFVSDGDLIAAFLTRVASRAAPSPRPIAFRNAFELRSRLPAIFDSSASYVGNYILMATTQVTAKEARTQPLGRLALCYRESLLEAAGESQIRGWLRTMHHVPGPLKILAEPTSIMFNCSNWGKAKFFEKVDFSAAVVGASTESTRGKPVFFQNLMVKTTPKVLRNNFLVLGKDPFGNYWMSLTMAPKAWPGIRKEITEFLF